MAQQVKVPIMVRGSLDRIQAALDTGFLKNLDRVLIGYINSGDHANELCFVTPDDKKEDGTFNVPIIKGNNEEFVQVVYSLPPVEEGKLNVLYIYNSKVYTFNGVEYHAVDEDVSQILQSIILRLDNDENVLTEHTNTIASMITRMAAIEQAIIDIGDITTLVNRVTTNEQNIATIFNDIAAIQQTLVELSERYTNEQIDQAIADAISALDYATPEDVQTALAAFGYSKDQIDTLLFGYYNKTNVDNMFDNVYNKSSIDTMMGNVYTKTETDDKIAEIVSESMEDPSSPITQAVETVITTQIDDKVGDLGGGDITVAEAIAASLAAAQQYTDETYDMAFS